MVVLWCRLGLGCRSNTSRARGGDARANLGNKKLMLGELGKRLKGTTTFLLLRHKFSLSLVSESSFGTAALRHGVAEESILGLT